MLLYDITTQSMCDIFTHVAHVYMRGYIFKKNTNVYSRDILVYIYLCIENKHIYIYISDIQHEACVSMNARYGRWTFIKSTASMGRVCVYAGYVNSITA